jgi:thiamine kinase-like enzyme
MKGPSYIPNGSLLKGRYEIQHEIGRGGYSVVYAARDRELDSDVAIKLLVPPPATAHTARERMRREVQAVRGLAHANIVAVHDFLEEGPLSFIVMEHVHGPDLSARLRDRGELDVEEVVRIGQGVAAALSAAHRSGILHRDVKPQNILLDTDGQARLTDFGSAKLEGQASVTRTGAFVGTIDYTAPEVIAGRRADARSDVYSLGMTLYFALTNRLPERPSPHLPPPPVADGYRPGEVREGVPTWLDGLIARATAASPGERYSTAASLHDDLEHREQGFGQAVESRPPRLEPCLICGDSEPLGLGVCPRCGGTSSGVADTLIFVQRSSHRAEKKARAERLQALLGARTDGAALEAVAAGNRALVRIPAASAAKVVRQLSQRQIPTRAVRASLAWAPLPHPFYGLLGSVIVVGGATEVAALGTVLMSPLIAALMLFTAQRRLKSPLVDAPKRVAPLPEQVEKKVIETFEQLPSGTARSLLADLVRIGQGLYASLDRSEHHREAMKELTGLLRNSCDAAVDLADLDENLSRLESQRERFPEYADDWIDRLSQCQRARDKLVQKLLEVMAALGEARSHSAEFVSAGGERLAELGREIQIHCDAHASAAQEIDELLGTPALSSGSSE